MHRDIPRRGRVLVRLLVAAGLLAVSACSSPEAGLNPVTGKVLVSGKGAEGAVVAFHPEGQSGMNVVPATGVAAADGSFTLNTNGKAGAKVGKYVVTVIWPEGSAGKKMPAGVIGTMGGDGDGGGKDRLGGRYATAAASTLRAEVKSGTNTLEPFDLK